MKFMRLITLSLAVLMLSACFVACGSDTKKETATINVTVSVIAPDQTLVEPFTLPVTYPVDDPATVLIAVTNALDDKAISYVLSDDENHVNAIDDYAEGIEGEGEAECLCFWEYTLNGSLPSDTVSAGTHVLADGDAIVYTFVKELISELEAEAE